MEILALNSGFGGQPL